MPLVACPECHNSLSSAAPSCPHCGHPMTVSVAVPTAAFPGAERELWKGSPSTTAMTGAILGWALFALLVTAGVFVLYGPALDFAGGLSTDVKRFVTRNEGGVRLAVIAFVVAVVGLKLARLSWRVAVLKSHHYRITDQRIVIESGVFSRQIEEIDMRTVEDLQFRQSLMERLLGIGDVTVISADKTVGRARLVGLERPRDLRELIRTSAYQATRGQLFTRQT
jgi:membrane protein YdbS with pleckstrin-like domain